MQALWRTYEYGGVCWDHENRRCCGAAQWATQRIAASHHALAAFYEQVTQQVGVSGGGALAQLLRLRDLLLLGRLQHGLAAQGVQPPLPCPAPPAPAQMAEDLAAAEARRRPVIAAQPTLHLELPDALRRAPPRLDMCSECAQNVQQVGRRVVVGGAG